MSALDVSIQSQILNLLRDLQRRLDFTLVFVAHDLSVVEHLCDRIAVMYLGRIVELGTRDDVFDRSAHPYTMSLLSAVPVPDPAAGGGAAGASCCRATCRRRPTRRPVVASTPAARLKRPTRCDDEVPELRVIGPGHTVACHWAEEIAAEAAAPGRASCRLAGPRRVRPTCPP